MSQPVSNFDFSKMSVEDRLNLIGEIWNTIEAEQPTIPLSDTQKRELQRRLDDLEASPESGVSWEEVKARLLSEP